MHRKQYPALSNEVWGIVLFSRVLRGKQDEHPLRQNGKNSGRESCSSLHLRECHNNQRAIFWNLVQVRQQLDLIMILMQYVGFQ